LERSLDGVAWSTIVTLPADATAFHDLGLTPETTYVYRARALNVSVYSAYSELIEAQTLPLPPLAPTTLSGTLKRLTWTLSWTDNSNNETSYKILRIGTRGAAWQQIGTAAANSQSFKLPKAARNQTYYYAVVASNAGGDSGPSHALLIRTHATYARPVAIDALNRLFAALGGRSKRA
jgi:titin